MSQTDYQTELLKVIKTFEEPDDVPGDLPGFVKCVDDLNRVALWVRLNCRLGSRKEDKTKDLEDKVIDLWLVKANAASSVGGKIKDSVDVKGKLAQLKGSIDSFTSKRERAALTSEPGAVTYLDDRASVQQTKSAYVLTESDLKFLTFFTKEGKELLLSFAGQAATKNSVGNYLADSFTSLEIGRSNNARRRAGQAATQLESIFRSHENAFTTKLTKEGREALLASELEHSGASGRGGPSKNGQGV